MDGITGLVAGAIGTIGNALTGMVHAVATALPAGAAPVLGIAGALLLLWLIFRR